MVDLVKFLVEEIGFFLNLILEGLVGVGDSGDGSDGSVELEI